MGLSSRPFRSVPFRSVPFHSIPFHSVPFRSVCSHHVNRVRLFAYGQRCTPTVQSGPGPRRGCHRHLTVHVFHEMSIAVLVWPLSRMCVCGVLFGSVYRASCSVCLTIRFPVLVLHVLELHDLWSQRIELA